MDVQMLVIWLIIGGVAGWLAGIVMNGTGYGLVGDIIVGIVGALVAGYLFPRLGIDFGGGIVSAIISAAIGAIILLFVAKLVKRMAGHLEAPSRDGAFDHEVSKAA